MTKLHFVALCSGIIAGLAAYTFWYAEGLSYLSSDPRSCANCHIMNSQYDSWLKSSHHAAATCADCHLPHDLIGKYAAKSSNGWHHSKGFTLQRFSEPIRIKPGNARILQENCVRCHNRLLHEFLAVDGRHDGSFRCVHCHRNAGHGETAGLGGPDQGEFNENKERASP